MQIALALLATLLPAAVFAQIPADCAHHSDAVALPRAYHPKQAAHYLEHDVTKMNAAIHQGFHLERYIGHIFVGPHASTVPLYHVYHPKIADHMYTIHQDKRAAAFAAGYVDKGIMGYVFPDARCGGIPIHPMWSTKNRDHYYSTLDAEQKAAQKATYIPLPWVEGYLVPA